MTEADSGILRSELEMVPPGDIRNVLTALSEVEPPLGQMLEYRFDRGNGLAGHSLGNLILAAMKDITGDFVTGVRELSRVLAVRGQVLPTANHAIILKAEMTDGTIVEGESKIPKAGGVIRRVFIEPSDVKPPPEALEALRQADSIIVGPGSLYTSIIPNLLVPEIAQTIVESKALKVFICNVMTQPGETDNYTVSDHINAIYEHVGHDLFDYVIINNGEIPEEVQHRYAEKGAKVVPVDEDKISGKSYQIIADQLVLFRTYLRHDAERLSQHIYQLVESWMFKKR